MSMRKFGLSSDMSGEDFFKMQVLEYFFSIGLYGKDTPEETAIKFISLARKSAAEGFPCNSAVLLVAAKAILKARAFVLSHPDCTPAEALRETLGEVGHLPGGADLNKPFSVLEAEYQERTKEVHISDVLTNNIQLADKFGFTGPGDKGNN